MGCSCGKEDPKIADARKSVFNMGAMATQLVNIDATIQARREKWRKDKLNIMNFLFSVIEKNKADDGGAPRLKLLYTSVVKQVKDIYSSPDIFLPKKFSFVKLENELNFNRKPYSKIKQDIDDFFIANPDLAQYDGFDFDNINLVKPYEMPSIPLSFGKTSNFEKEKVTIDVGKDEILILFLFNYLQFKPFQKMKELVNYLIENPVLREKVRIVPVVNEAVNNDVAAKNIEDRLNLLGFKNYNLTSYVWGDENDNLKDYFSWRNDEDSICIIYDKQGVVRRVCKPSEIFADDIKQYLGAELGYNKKKFSDDKKILLQEGVFSGLKSNSIESGVSYELWMKKEKIFSAKDKLDNIFYHPPHLKLNYSTKLGPAKEELVKSLCNKVSSTCMTFVKPITGKEVQNVIAEEILKIKEKNTWTEPQNYVISFDITYLLHRNYYFGKSKETKLSLNYYLNEENSLELPTLLADLEFLRMYPQLPNFGSISYQAEIGKELPSLLSLHDENYEEDILDLSDKSKPKAIFIVDGEITDMDQFIKYRQIFWENIQKFIGEDGRYDLHIILRSNSFDTSGEYFDHDLFKQKVFLWKRDNIDSDLRINVNKPFDYHLILLNKNNLLQYVGDITDLDLSQSLTKLLHDKPLVFQKANVKNRTNFSDFKQKLSFLCKGLNKHFDDQGFIYKPFLEFKYSHKIEMNESKELSSSYHSFFLKLKLKDVSKTIMDKPDVVFFTKYFKNDFGGILTIDYVDTIPLQDSGKCSFCPKMFPAKTPHYFDQETNTYLCEQCEASKNSPEKMIYHPTNLIYICYENPRVLFEVIKQQFETNRVALDWLEQYEGQADQECAICQTRMDTQRVRWISMLHLFDNRNMVVPVMICDTFCMPILLKKESAKDLYFNEQQTANMKMSCIDPKNLIFRKAIMPDTMV